MFPKKLSSYSKRFRGPKFTLGSDTTQRHDSTEGSYGGSKFRCACLMTDLAGARAGSRVGSRSMRTFARTRETSRSAVSLEDSPWKARAADSNSMCFTHPQGKREGEKEKEKRKRGFTHSQGAFLVETPYFETKASRRGCRLKGGLSKALAAFEVAFFLGSSSSSWWQHPPLAEPESASRTTAN